MRAWNFAAPVRRGSSDNKSRGFRTTELHAVRNTAFAIIFSTAAAVVFAQEDAHPVAVGLTTALPALTTVVVTGSSAYATPRLFATYRDSLGQPISRDIARAIVTAVSDLYDGDGY